MDTFIKIAVVPLATGLLSALIFLFAVKFLEERIDYFSIKQWGKHLTAYEGFKILGGIVTLGVALFGAYSGTHKDFCDKREEYANEIIDLIPRISNAVNYEIGAGNICYTYDGKSTMVLSNEIFRAAENLRTNLGLFSFKIKIFPESSVVEAASNYNNAIKDIKLYCKDVKPDEFQRKQSVVFDSGYKLNEILGTLNADCYQ